MTGSGLGLSIAKRVAQLHGLQLEFNARPTGGLAVRLIKQLPDSDRSSGGEITG